jgi:hypothetical protein
VAGAEGIVRVHVPFSLTDLSQIEKRLGSFTTNPDSYVKESQYLAQSYDLTWHDIYLILSSTLLPEEKNGSGMWLGHMQMRSIAPPPPIL